MTLDEAIEILTFWDTNLDAWNEADTDAAVRLGSEALKRLEHERSLHTYPAYKLLPGETED